MALSTDLISQFVKSTNDSTTSTTTTTIYGTAKEVAGSWYVLVDGSEQLVPVSTTVSLSEGDRVTMTIENHSATVTGNLTDTSASSSSVSDLSATVDEYSNTLLICENEITLLKNDIAMYNSYISITDGSITIDGVSLSLLQSEISSQGDVITLLNNTIDLYNSYITISDGSITIDGVSLTLLNSIVSSQGDSISSINNDITSISNSISSIDNELVLVNNTISVINSSFEITDGVVTGLKGIDGLVYLTTAELIADHAWIASADIGVINANIANIIAVLSGSIGTGELETVYLTTENAVLDTAIIVNAIMSEAIIGDLLAGNIYTSELNIQTSKGDTSLWIAGSTIQFSDANRVRMQLGEDANGDFNAYIWNESGSLIFDATNGVTADGISSGVIVDSHVATGAAISGSKLDISSVASYLNDSGQLVVEASQVTINSSTLYAFWTEVTDTLDEMESDINDLETSTSTLTTKFELLNGYFSSKIWMSDIASALSDYEYEDPNYVTIMSQYSEIIQLYNSITETVSDLSTEVGDNYSTLYNYISNVEQTASSITTTVTAIETTLEYATYRNYALMSGDYTADDDASNIWWVYASAAYNKYTVTCYDGYTRIYCTSTSGNYAFYLSVSDAFEGGETYTVSVKMRSYATGNVVVYMTTGSSQTSLDTVSVAAGEWVTREVTFTAGEDNEWTGIGLVPSADRTAGSYLDVAYVMVEKGETAHDWSRAPEDYATTSYVSSSYTTLSSAISSIEQTAESITQTVSSLNTTVYDYYTELSNSISSVTQTAEGITSTVSSLESALGYASYRNYALLSGGYTEEDDPLEAWWCTSTYYGSYYTVTANDGYVRFECKTTTTSGYYFYLNLADAFEADGTTYTITAKVRCSSAVKVPMYARKTSTSGTAFNSGLDTTLTISTADEWTIFSVTHTTSSTYSPYTAVGFYLGNLKTAGNYLDVAYVMVEKGETAHDWSRAPEDYATTSYVSSSIEQLADSITLSVTGSLGGTATISILADGTALDSSTLSLSGVRSAFASDTTAVIISSGTMTFNNNTFVVNSTNFSVTAAGTLSATNAEISGTVTTESGLFKSVLESGRLRLYYDSTLYGAFASSHWAESDEYEDGDTDYRGIALNLTSAGKYIALGCDTDDDGVYEASYILNYGLNPSGYTERNIFYNATRFVGSTYYNKGLYLERGTGKGIYMPDEDGYDTGVFFINSTNNVFYVGNSAMGTDMRLYGDTFRFYTASGGSGAFRWGPSASRYWAVRENRAGQVTITPSAANTPTSSTITFGVTFTSAPLTYATVHSTVPGTQVTGVGTASASKTGFTIWVTRTNTTATLVNYLCISDDDS